MAGDLQAVSLDKMAIQAEMNLNMRKMELSAEVSTLAAGDYRAHTALVSARNKAMLAGALASGMIPGVGVGASISNDGLSASEFVWGAPVTLANGRTVPFFEGKQLLRQGVSARFEVSDGKMFLYYNER